MLVSNVHFQTDYKTHTHTIRADQLYDIYIVRVTIRDLTRLIHTLLKVLTIRLKR